jgi:hypothetical protein
MEIASRRTHVVTLFLVSPTRVWQAMAWYQHHSKYISNNWNYNFTHGFVPEQQDPSSLKLNTTANTRLAYSLGCLSHKFHPTGIHRNELLGWHTVQSTTNNNTNTSMCSQHRKDMLDMGIQYGRPNILMPSLEPGVEHTQKTSSVPRFISDNGDNGEVSAWFLKMGDQNCSCE